MFRGIAHPKPLDFIQFSDIFLKLIPFRFVGRRAQIFVKGIHFGKVVCKADGFVFGRAKNLQVIDDAGAAVQRNDGTAHAFC